MLRGVCCESGFGVGRQRVIIRQTILWANVLENLLVNVEFSSSVGKPVIIVAESTVAEVVLVISHAAVATVGRAVKTLRIRS